MLEDPEYLEEAHSKCIEDPDIRRLFRVNKALFMEAVDGQQFLTRNAPATDNKCCRCRQEIVGRVVGFQYFVRPKHRACEDCWFGPEQSAAGFNVDYGMRQNEPQETKGRAMIHLAGRECFGCLNNAPEYVNAAE